MFPFKKQPDLFTDFSDYEIAFSTSKTLIKEGVNMVAGFKKRSRLSLVLQLRAVQGCWCAWGDSTGEQQSNAAEVCISSESCRLFIRSLLL